MTTSANRNRSRQTHGQGSCDDHGVAGLHHQPLNAMIGNEAFLYGLQEGICFGGGHR